MAELDRRLAALLSAPAGWQPTELRRAAVLCPIVAGTDGDHLLLLRRPDDAPKHPGQLAFPGGMQQGEESPVATALRECHEEIGMPPSAVTVLGELTPRNSSTGIFVHCLVARVAPMPLRPDPREVVRVLHVPVAEVCDENRWQQLPPPPPYVPTRPTVVPQFRIGADVLWGLTARFVRELAQVLAARP